MCIQYVLLMKRVIHKDTYSTFENMFKIMFTYYLHGAILKSHDQPDTSHYLSDTFAYRIK